MKKTKLNHTRRLILIRHAHRYKTNTAADNGLSPKGRRQAQALKELFRARFGSADALLLSSPKKRCLQTVLGLESRRNKLMVDPRLDEGDLRLRLRVNEFIRWWRQGPPKRGDAPPITVVCSHGDWLPLAIAALTGVRVELKKGGWAEIVLEVGQPRLDWLVQEP